MIVTQTALWCATDFGLLTLGCCYVQYAELGFKIYEEYYASAATVLAVSLLSGFLSTIAAFRKRMHLYTSIEQHHLVPVVVGGHVR